MLMVCLECGGTLRRYSSAFAFDYYCLACGYGYTSQMVQDFMGKEPDKEPDGTTDSNTAARPKLCQNDLCKCPIEGSANYCQVCWTMYEIIWDKPYWRREHEKWVREEQSRKYGGG